MATLSILNLENCKLYNILRSCKGYEYQQQYTAHGAFFWGFTLALAGVKPAKGEFSDSLHLLVCHPVTSPDGLIQPTSLYNRKTTRVGFK